MEPSLQENLEAFETANVGLAIWSARIEFPSHTEAEAARNELRAIDVGVVDEGGVAPRVAVVFDKLLAPLVARIITLRAGTVRGAASSPR